MPVNRILTKGDRRYKINNYKDISRLPMNKEQTAIPCCPYCKSRIGYEKREAIQWYWYYAADGTPDGHSEPRTIKELSWENPRCMNCGRPLMEVDIPFLYRKKLQRKHMEGIKGSTEE